MKIIGLDLSLTATGVATIQLDGTDVEPWTTTATLTSRGSKGADLDHRGARLRGLAAQLIVPATEDDVALVLLEGPSLGQQRQTGQHDRAGLWWLVVERLTAYGKPVAEVPPSVVKKYATGKGNAAKDAVLAAVVRRYPDVDVADNNQADALVLAAMGARHLGRPVETTLPAVQIAALGSVRWPNQEAPF